MSFPLPKLKVPASNFNVPENCPVSRPAARSVRSLGTQFIEQAELFNQSLPVDGKKVTVPRYGDKLLALESLKVPFVINRV